MLQKLIIIFALIVSLTACPIPIVRSYRADLDRTSTVLPVTPRGSLVGQIENGAFIVTGYFSDFINDAGASSSTGAVTSVTITSTELSGTCTLAFTSQVVPIVPPTGTVSYNTLTGQINGRCDVTSNSTAWLDALTNGKVVAFVNSVNFPNGVVKGTFIPQ